MFEGRMYDWFSNHMLPLAGLKLPVEKGLGSDGRC